MKDNISYTIFLFFLLLIYAGSVINQKETREQSVKSTREVPVSQENSEDTYYHDLVYKEEVPLTQNETPELAKYREDLVQWYEWNNECMGMDPNSKPKDPRLKHK